MKRSIYILAISAFFSLNIVAQTQDSISVFASYLNAPLNICPMLTPQQRFEMIENAKVGKFDTITNFMLGKAWIDSTGFSSEHIIINQTTNSRLELKCFGDTLLTIQTFYAPLPSSRISLFSTKWEHIRDIPLSMPECHNMPATFLSAKIIGDSIVIENHTLDQVFNINDTEYRDCPRQQSIPIQL